MGQGRIPALLVTLGISTGMLFWAVAVSFGLGAIFTTYPIVLVVLKVVGGTNTIRGVFSYLEVPLQKINTHTLGNSLILI